MSTTPQPIDDDLDEAFAEATANARTLLEQARHDDQELHRLRAALDRACCRALKDGLGLDARTNRPLAQSVECASLEVDATSSGAWIDLHGRPQGSQRLTPYRLPRTAVIRPDTQELHGQRIDAFFLGAAPPAPNPEAISDETYQRLQDLQAKARTWTSLVLDCAEAADDAGRLQVAAPKPFGGPVWSRSLREERRARQIDWDDLHTDTATIQADGKPFGSIPWETLLIFDPDSELYQRFAARRDNAVPPPHLAQRHADAEKFDATRRIIAMANRSVTRAQQTPRPTWRYVTVTSDDLGSPIINLPLNDTVRGQAQPRRLILDPAISSQTWTLEYSDGHREATKAAIDPDREGSGYALSLGDYLDRTIRRAHEQDSGPSLWATATWR